MCDSVYFIGNFDSLANGAVFGRQCGLDGQCYGSNRLGKLSMEWRLGQRQQCDGIEPDDEHHVYGGDHRRFGLQCNQNRDGNGKPRTGGEPGILFHHLRRHGGSGVAEP